MARLIAAKGGKPVLTGGKQKKNLFSTSALPNKSYEKVHHRHHSVKTRVSDLNFKENVQYRALVVRYFNEKFQFLRGNL